MLAISKTLRTVIACASLTLPASVSAQEFTGTEAYSKASGAYSAATGAMILGQIDFADTNDWQVGIGTGNIGGHLGVGVKLMVPLGDRFHATIGTFQIEDGRSGTAAAIIFKF